MTRTALTLALAPLALAALGCATPKPADPADPAATTPTGPTATTATTPAATSRSGMALTRKVPVVDTYHGVSVSDPYRWLESAEAPEVRAFMDAQNVHARAMLDKIEGRGVIEGRLREILSAATVSYGSVIEVGGQLFAIKNEPPKQQPFLVVMPGPDAPEKERVVVDPNRMDAGGKVSIEWFRVSPDGKRVACSMSSGGSETGDAHVFDVATGKELEVVPGVNAGTAGGDLAWLPDSSGFYYTRYPRGAERPAEDRLFYVQLWLHQNDTPTDKDTYELGRDFVRIAEVFVDVNPAGLVLVTVQKGDGGEFELHLKDPSAKDAGYQKLASFEDRVVQAFFGARKDLYLLSRRDAPKGKLLRAPIAGFDLAKAKVVVPEAKDALVSDIWADDVVTVHQGRLFLQYQLGGPSELRVFDLDGKAKAGPKHLPVSAVSGAVPLKNGDVLFANTSFVSPALWVRFSQKGSTAPTKISGKSPVDLSGVTVVREMAKSKDGTEVPVNILLPKGTAPGAALPFLVTGYGGYGVNIEPGFQSLRSVVLDRGVGVAIVNLRGGAEFGEAWHQAGALTHKQNVFDDFIAAVEHLVAKKHAAAGRIAITGGSNGGLLMGAVLTQRPELFAAVASFVGIYDMMRVETEPNGAFNTTEFGSVKDKAQFDALYAYSPFHHVKDGTSYPPTLFLIGANDVRVAPWHSRKMTARLQEASSSSSPILLVTSFGAGHGIGSALDETIAQQTDAYAFMLQALGVPLAK
ncbi:MAG: S9 family peptidase [Deltaproteobacteria bacterium]|nr:S9 family peptidase [Deltaproteobacteria bacterium]